MFLTVSITSCYTRIKQHNKHQWSYTNVLKRKPSLLKHTEELWPHIHSPSLRNEDTSVLWRWHWKMAGSRANMGTMIDHESQQKVKRGDKCVGCGWVALHIDGTVCVFRTWQPALLRPIILCPSVSRLCVNPAETFVSQENTSTWLGLGAQRRHLTYKVHVLCMMSETTDHFKNGCIKKVPCFHLL